ncbi:hypothetical protein RF11_04017 [Thelohanellus kitauei]|uniref:ISXO2-like transposase domain-containing protein n=1 Tax=Thelohanellus kitauei TaxID=669202 RepID=A0A0C2IV42_THEKT|nr:hypothetical protein RF11_04017 [Thelohanellus kitauei]
MYGHWIFGGYERSTQKVFVVQVLDPTRESVFSVINESIEPGAIIMSDFWKSYRTLDERGFEHLCSNHSVKFVDSDTGAHTKGMERVSRYIRSKILRYGTRQYHADGYLAQFILKMKYPVKTGRVHQFVMAIYSLYLPPKKYLLTRCDSIISSLF